MKLSIVAVFLGLITVAAQAAPRLSQVSSIGPSSSVGAIEGLEATNLKVEGNRVYLVYNSAGSAVHGALEIYDVSDRRKPCSVGSIAYSTAEFSDVAIKGQFAYLVGDEIDPKRQGAVLKVVDISNPAKPRQVGEVEMTGYTATSIQISGDEAVVSVGDNAGILVFDVSVPSAPKIKTTINLPGALYGKKYHGDIVALSGAISTHLTLFHANGSTDGQPLTIATHCATSPARFKIRGHVLYTNAEATGLSIVSLPHFFDGQLKMMSHAVVPGTGNGLDLVGDRLFLAQGDRGLFIFDVSHPENPRNLGPLDFHFPGESTNEVKYVEDHHQCDRDQDHDCGSLFVANGKGGLRIFELHE